MATFSLSDQQARAIQPASHIWVDASAGTGKTHVLTARVLRLMVEGAHPASILCLTYTKAAAGEMTNRILGHLGRWATTDEAALKTELATLLGGRSLVTEDAMNRARKLFLDVVDLPTGLNVQTLHAFSQSLLGRFPIEARTAPGFETLDERTTEELLARSRDDVLASAVAGVDTALAEASQALARILADQAFHETVGALRGIAQDVLKLPKAREQLLKRVQTALDLKPGLTREGVMLEACADDAFDRDGLKSVITAITDHGTENEKDGLGAMLATWLILDPAKRAQDFDSYAAVFLTTENTIRKKLLTKNPAKAFPDGLDIMAREAERVLKVNQTCALLVVAQQSCDGIIFGQRLINGYERAKESAAKLDYDDLIERTRALLETPDIPTWVMYKLDTQISHILVDEAQDNSDVQWRIIDRLSQDFFAGTDEDRARSIFAVGDMKQSIYGFQGARPELFETTRGDIRMKAEQAGQHFEDVPLNQSFRSVSAVLDVVDTVFTRTDAHGRQNKHRSFRQGVGGMVDLWPVTVPDKTEQDETGWHLPLRERREMKADQILAQKIAGDIKCRLAAKEHLPGRSKPLSAGDFLILVRRRNDFVIHMVRALKRRGIAVAGVDRFDLKAPLAVRDLLNVARFVCLPQDDYTLACALKGPFCNVSEDMLMELCAQRKGSLWQHIQSHPAMPEPAMETLKSALKRADFMPPFEFFSHILQAGGRRALLTRLGEEAGDAIDELLEQCLIYEQSHVPSLDGFIQWFMASDEDVKRDAEAAGDKVRVMTVHGAKGLQAPVVYLPDLVGTPDFKKRFIPLEQVSKDGKPSTIPIFRRRKDAEIGPLKDATDSIRAADYEEYLRLLYVAMTRAEDHLICCGYRSGKTQNRAGQPDAYALVEAAMNEMADVVRLPDEVKRYAVAQSAAVPAPKLQDAKQSSAIETPSWLFSAPPEEDSPPRPLRPSDREDDAPKLFTLREEGAISAAKRGTLVHKLLEHLPQLPKSNRTDVGAQFLRQSLPGAPDGLITDLLEQAENTLALEALAPLFGPGSRAEVPLVAKLGNFVVSGTIDRLSVLDGQVLYIDYKTSAAPPQTIADITPSYMRQMALYHFSLKQMFAGQDVKGALVWTVSGRVDWLDDQGLGGYLPSGANSAFS